MTMNFRCRPPHRRRQLKTASLALERQSMTLTRTQKGEVKPNTHNMFMSQGISKAIQRVYKVY